MTSDHGGGSITSVLQETRVFAPPPDFASKATKEFNDKEFDDEMAEVLAEDRELLERLAEV